MSYIDDNHDNEVNEAYLNRKDQKSDKKLINEDLAIEILDATASKIMLRWDRRGFKDSHPRLFKTIIQSMMIHSNEQNSQLLLELEKAKELLRESDRIIAILNDSDKFAEKLMSKITTFIGGTK